jgi:hypothetical protein
MMPAAKHFFERLRRCQDGVAMVEFAYSLVIIVPLVVGGVELANYVTTKMRVSQIALHAADNASRIGIDSLLAKPRITEAQINDLLIGADMQGGNLDIANRGRVIISSVEPDPSNAGKFMIRWQRCYGAMNWTSSYGDAGDTNLAGVGPPGQQVTASAGSGVMFVEVAYDYEPLIASDIVSSQNFRETASMVVRDDRDYIGNAGTGIYNTEGVTPSTCP